MPRGVILVDYTEQVRRTIKDSPDRAEVAKAEAVKLGVQVKDIFYTPGGTGRVVRNACQSGKITRWQVYEGL